MLQNEQTLHECDDQYQAAISSDAKGIPSCSNGVQLLDMVILKVIKILQTCVFKLIGMILFKLNDSPLAAQNDYH